MIKAQIKEGKLIVFWRGRERSDTEVAAAEKATAPTVLKIIYDAIKENRMQRIDFDMILCNRKTCLKALKSNRIFWSEFKEKVLFDAFSQKPPEYLRLFNYLFGVNKESEALTDNELIFLKDCQRVSEFKNGKLTKKEKK